MDTELVNALKAELAGWSRLAILGVGNEYGGDDAAGLLTVRQIKVILHTASANIRLFETGVSPENFTGPLRDFKPSHVIFIDCADMGKAPGQIKVLDPHHLQGTCPSTHSLSLAVVSEYIEREFGSIIVILGIQPKTMSQGNSVSPEIIEAASELGTILAAYLGEKELT